MKSFFSITCLLLLCFAVSAQISTPPAAGDGSSGNPFQIATLDNLYWLSQTNSEWGKYYILTNNINAASTSAWNSGAGFDPIGNSTVNFTGNFDGQNNTIDGLIINRSTTDYQGLFGRVSNASFSNIKLANVDIKGKHYCGSIYGRGVSSPVDNCSASGNMDVYRYCGGIVGDNTGGAISNCTSKLDIVGFRSIGGIAGVCKTNSATVSDCSYEGSMDYLAIKYGGAIFGGIVGRTETNVSNCCAIVDIEAGNYTGGVVGWGDLKNNTYGNISNCKAEGIITANWGFGGVVGIHGSNGSSREIKDCYSTADLVMVQGRPRDESSSFSIGGVVGYSRDFVRNCFYGGTISGSGTTVGGIRGENFSGSGVFNSVFDITKNPGKPVTAGSPATNSSGQSTANMQLQATYLALGWDFSSVWSIASGAYPDLQNISCSTAAPTNQDPDCSAAAIANQTADASCGATISGADVTGVTDGDGDPLTITVSPAVLVLGANTVTVSADDGNGGMCSTTITVTVEDNTPPTPSVASLSPVSGLCSASVIVVPVATDNCGFIVTATTTDATSYSIPGTYTINWEYNDGNGNTTPQTQTVTVQDFDVDGDGVSVCSGDCDDNDGSNYPGNVEICDGQDNNCDGVVDEGSTDTDNDGDADCVDTDDDNDGIADVSDNCPLTANPGQEDLDLDGLGDACDATVSVCDAIDGLANHLTSLNLNNGTSSSLTSKLNHANNKFQNGQTNAALNMLNAFINSVNAQSGKKINGSDAADLIATVNAITAAINSGNTNCTGGGNRLGNTGNISPILNLYPNPATSQVTISLSGLDASYQVTIHDQLGKVVWQKQLQGGEHALNLSEGHFANGIYFVRAITADKYHTKRLVIVK